MVIVLPFEKWEICERMASMIIKQTISATVHVAIPDKDQDNNELSAKAYLDHEDADFTV
jgi:hypothetical protein